MRKAILASCALLLLLIPQSQAAVLGTVSTPRILASEAVLTGSLASITLEEASSYELSTFEIRGDINGVIDIDEATLVVGNNAITPSTTSSQPIHSNSSKLTTVGTQDGLRIIVKPISGTASLSQLTANLLPQAEEIPFETRSVGRPPNALPTADTLETHPVSGDLTLNGTFEVYLYAVNFTLENAVGASHYKTGFERRAYVTGPIPGNAASTTVREAVLTVEGTLRAQVTSSWKVYLQQPVISTGDGSLTLIGAIGDLTGVTSQVLDGEDLHVTGDVQYGPRIEGERLSGALTGHLDSLTVAGEAIPVSDNGPATWLWLGLLMTLLVLSYGGYRTAASRGVSSLERLLAKGEYHHAIRRATKLMWLPRAAEDAVVVQGVSWLKLGRVDKAKAVVDAPPRGRDRIRPGRLYLKARIAGLQGDIQQAKEHLLNCLLLAPNYLVEALSDPVLAPLVKDVQREAQGAYT